MVISRATTGHHPPTAKGVNRARLTAMVVGASRSDGQLAINMRQKFLRRAQTSIGINHAWPVEQHRSGPPIGTLLAKAWEGLSTCRVMPTVLLVDDDLENRWALQLALESRGHRVVLAENGCNALQKARAVLPQLIITDLQMPEMNGGELCRHLKCGAAFSGVPVLLLSAMPEPTAGIRCWTAYLRKPVSMEELLDTVDMFIAARLTYGRALGDSEPPPQPAGEPSTRDVGPERTLIERCCTGSTLGLAVFAARLVRIPDGTKMGNGYNQDRATHPVFRSDRTMEWCGPVATVRAAASDCRHGDRIADYWMNLTHQCNRQPA
ncbi:PleD family two-component system response regulator [Paraburkholderia sp. BR13444]|uniref:PleD family two-component system response regulator n=1 Tax=Paraburkholderia sp. BR13444 TaxID=3236997 RepID=UPI0034CDCDE2